MTTATDKNKADILETNKLVCALYDDFLKMVDNRMDELKLSDRSKWLVVARVLNLLLSTTYGVVWGKLAEIAKASEKDVI
jgi:hypothetical protein